jgi:hypothetical protein
VSYIQAFTIEESDTFLEGNEASISAELDSEPIAFCARLLSLVDDLDEDTVIIIRKVIY